VNALRQYNPDLHAALVEQLDLFREALLGDDDEEVWRQGDALNRGWSQALVECARQLWPSAQVMRVRDKGEPDVGEENA
jgi:hypothetical protein